MAAVVIRENQLLVMFRRKKGKEYFAFPGGGVEEGETEEEALIREIKEETSIDAKIGQKLYGFDGKLGREYFFLCSYVSGEPQLAKDSPEFLRLSEENYYQPQWIDLAEVSKITLYPLVIKEQLLLDYEKGFAKEVREVLNDQPQ